MMPSQLKGVKMTANEFKLKEYIYQKRFVDYDGKDFLVSIMEYKELVRCKDCVLKPSCKTAFYLGDEGFCSEGRRVGYEALDSIGNS